MHIPGGLVSDPVCMLTTVASSSALGLGLWKVSRPANRCGGQSLAAVGALVFAVQMVNFPVDPGTSGHLIGGALAAALLGPWGAMWAMASVVTTQALVFGDGGIATLGANLLSMAVVAPWAAWLSYRGLAYCGLANRDGRLEPAGSDAQFSGRDALCWGLASLVSVLAAATICSLVLAWGDAAPAGRVLPAMLLAHLPVGLVEGAVTAAVVLLAAGQFVLAPRVLLALAAGVAAVLAPFASARPMAWREWPSGSVSPASRPVGSPVCCPTMFCRALPGLPWPWRWPAWLAWRSCLRPVIWLAEPWPALGNRARQRLRSWSRRTAKRIAAFNLAAYDIGSYAVFLFLARRVLSPQMKSRHARLTHSAALF